MYRGNNPTALQSQEWIRIAFLKLLESKPKKMITIKEICEEAGLARQTFYQLFDAKEEILGYHLDLLFKQYIHEIEKEQNINIQQIALLYFEFFKHNESFISLLIKNNVTNILSKKFCEYLIEIKKLTKETNDNPMDDYAFAFISGALVEILIFWFKDNMRISSNDLSILINAILEGEYFSLN